MAVIKDKIRSHLVIINSNKYAGNFERLVCTALTGESSMFVKDDSNLFYESNRDVDVEDWISEHIVQEHCNMDMPGNSPYFGPCSVWENDLTGDYNSFAIFFDELPPEYVIVHFEKLLTKIKAADSSLKNEACLNDVEFLSFSVAAPVNPKAKSIVHKNIYFKELGI